MKKKNIYAQKMASENAIKIVEVTYLGIKIKVILLSARYIKKFKIKKMRNDTDK